MSQEETELTPGQRKILDRIAAIIVELDSLSKQSHILTFGIKPLEKVVVTVPSHYERQRDLLGELTIQMANAERDETLCKTAFMQTHRYLLRTLRAI